MYKLDHTIPISRVPPEKQLGSNRNFLFPTLVVKASENNFHIFYRKSETGLRLKLLIATENTNPRSSKTKKKYQEVFKRVRKAGQV